MNSGIFRIMLKGLEKGILNVFFANVVNLDIFRSTAIISRHQLWTQIFIRVIDAEKKGNPHPL